MTDTSSLSSLARSKLQQSLTKESGSLHRWVLLKNSITRNPPLTATTFAVNQPDIHSAPLNGGDEEYEEEYGDEERDSFLFPDAGKLLDSAEEDVPASEAQWLDSLLETLADEDGEDELSVDLQVSTSLMDDEEDLPLSPLISPMSSSDDLINQSVYFPTPIPTSCPVSYPALLHAFDNPQPLMDSSYAEHALPYRDIDDIEELSVPDAVEDTSDDESSAPPTPSLRDSASTLSPVDPASIPLPPERRRRPHPQVYIRSDTTFFFPFELDPLPFAENELRTYTDDFQEC